MGICSSHAFENDLSNMLQEHINVDKEKQKKIVKLLILGIFSKYIVGPGDSGKSTIRKQFQIIHCKGFSDADRIAVCFHI